MRVTFRCKNCRNIIYIKYSDEDTKYLKCPHCGFIFGNQQYINPFLDQAYYLKRVLTDLEFVRLEPVRKNDTNAIISAVGTSPIFDQAMKRINKIYELSDDEIQNEISNIIDITYLILNRISKDTKSDLLELQKFKDIIHSYLLESSKKRNKELFDKYLSVDSDSEDTDY